MSSARRASAVDESILARLERGPGRSAKSRMAVRAEYLWCAAAMLVGLVLLAVLGYLVYENVTQPRVLAVAATKAQLTGSTAIAPPAIRATVVDETPAPAAAVLPPMVMLATAVPPATVTVIPVPIRITAPAKPAPMAKAINPAVRKVKAPAAAAAKPVSPESDSDIDLLTAILSHSSRHAREHVQQEAAACAAGSGKKCPDTAAARP